MVRKLQLVLLLSVASLVQAMNHTNFQSTGCSGYVIKQTGLGKSATSELVYDPMLAEMMDSMNKAEAACYARERKAANEKATIALNSPYVQEVTAAFSVKQQNIASKPTVKKDETSFGSGFKKGFLDTSSKKK